MFTGIIEELGKIGRISKSPSKWQLELSAEKIMDNMLIGDSINVNGVCLTVSEKTTEKFTVDVMPETLKRSNLGELKPGSRINLESALVVGNRIGGHYVTGHVDDTGVIISKKKAGNSTIIKISIKESTGRYLAVKGSVAVDGISLTITGADEKSFSVALIPHTMKMTTLGFKKSGETVNIEADIMSRYAVEYIDKTARKKSNLANLLKEYEYE